MGGVRKRRCCGCFGSRWRGEILSEQARAGVRDRHFPEAIALAQASLAVDPANPYTYQHLGDAYRLQFLSQGFRRPGPEPERRRLGLEVLGSHDDRP